MYKTQSYNTVVMARKDCLFPICGRNGRKNRVTIFLNSQFIIVYTCM